MTRRRIVGARPLGRAPTVAIAVLAMAYAAAAVAQQAVIDRCKQTSSDADRIACLEAALLGRELDIAEAPEAPSMEPDAGPAADEVAPVADEPIGIGAQQVIGRNMTREEQLERLEEAQGLHVASYDVVPFKRLVIRLQNGQVWRQIKGDTQDIRATLKRNQTVDISESSLGGYKMRLNEMRRTVRVERLE